MKGYLLRFRECPVCHSWSYKKTGYGIREAHSRGPHICKCNVCGMIYLNPVMTDKSYEDFYNEDSQRKFSSSVVDYDYNKKVSRQTKYRVDVLGSIADISKISIMDIGSGMSDFVTKAMDSPRVISAVGIEPSTERAKQSAKMGNNIICTNIFDDEIRDINANVITLFQVLEHIVNPHAFLKRIHDIMPDNGYLIIEVPNHNDILVRLNRYKKFYYQNAHCSYFTPKTLEMTLGMCDFDITKSIKKQRYSLGNHLGWLFNMPGKTGKSKMYNGVLKALGVHDTIIFVCRKTRRNI